MKKVLLRAGLLALLTCMLLLTLTTAEAKYKNNFLLNWQLAQTNPGNNNTPTAIGYHPTGSAVVIDGGTDDKLGYDVVYYTGPIQTDTGVYENAPTRGNHAGSSMTFLNCPAGWYAFGARGADGGNGPPDPGNGGVGGQGAVVTGYTYIPGGTIVIVAGRAGRCDVGRSGTQNQANPQWGGGTIGTNGRKGGDGGGLSGVFYDETKSVTATTITETILGTMKPVAIGGGGGGGGCGGGYGNGNPNPGGNGGAGNGTTNLIYPAGVTYGKPGQGGGMSAAESKGQNGGISGSLGGYAPTEFNNGRAEGHGQPGTGGGGGGGGGAGGTTGNRSSGGAGGGRATTVSNTGSSDWVGIGGGGGSGYYQTASGSPWHWRNANFGGNGGGSTATVNTPAGSAPRAPTLTYPTSGILATHGMQGGNAISSGNTGASDGGGAGGGFMGGWGGCYQGGGSGGGGGGASFLKANTYALTTLPAPFNIYPTISDTSNTYLAANYTDGGAKYNGYAWIMYLGARNPTDAELVSSGGYRAVP